MDRIQINVRITLDLADQLDSKRIDLKEKFGKIPSRSDVVRMALKDYLAQKKEEEKGN